MRRLFWLILALVVLSPSKGFSDGAPSVVSADGSANGGALPAPIVAANSFVDVNVSAAGDTQLVALASGKRIYITGYSLMTSGPANIKFDYGTGTNCATGTTVIAGPYPMAAQAAVNYGNGLGDVAIVPAGNALCVNLSSGSSPAYGIVSYAQY